MFGERPLAECSSRSVEEVPPTALGRKDRFVAGGSSQWPELVAGSLTCLRVSPPSNVKFRGKADNCPRNWPTSGVGARRQEGLKGQRG